MPQYHFNSLIPHVHYLNDQYNIFITSNLFAKFSKNYLTLHLLNFIITIIVNFIFFIKFSIMFLLFLFKMNFIFDFINSCSNFTIFMFLLNYPNAYLNATKFLSFFDNYYCYCYYLFIVMLVIILCFKYSKKHHFLLMDILQFHLSFKILIIAKIMIQIKIIIIEVSLF